MSREIDRDLISGLAPERADNGHKGTFGTALLVAGSKYMTGALVLSTSSALRSGAGLVKAYSDDDALMPVKVNCPCALTASFEDTPEATLRKLMSFSRVTSAGIGPGLDENDKRSYALLAHLIENMPSLVIDAGALNIISRNREYFFPLLAARRAPAILTPHVGECRRLLKNPDVSINEETINDLASELNAIIVVKSSTTIISDCGRETYVIEGNNSGMAKGGSGDVLMGLMTGLSAQGMSGINAALAAVYIHSAAGKMAAQELHPRVMLPEDIISYFPDAMDEIGW